MSSSPEESHTKTLTADGLDDVGDVEAAAGGQGPQESGHVRGAVEALLVLLQALAVVDLQVHDRPEETRRTNDVTVYLPPFEAVG